MLKTLTQASREWAAQDDQRRAWTHVREDMRGPDFRATPEAGFWVAADCGDHDNSRDAHADALRALSGRES